MTVPVRAQTTTTQSAGATVTSLSMTAPNTLVSGDLGLICVFNDDLSATEQFSINATNHPGWTKVDEVGDTVSDCHVALFSRTADGSADDGDVTVDSVGNNEMGGWYWRFTGANNDAPINDYALQSTTLLTAQCNHTFAAGAVVTSVDDCYLICVCAIDGADSTSQSATGLTEGQYVKSGTTGNDASALSAYGSLVTAGSTLEAVLKFASGFGEVEGEGTAGFFFAIAPKLITRSFPPINLAKSAFQHILVR